MKLNVLKAALFLCAAGLAGCGEKAADSSAAATAASDGAPENWNAADACSILDKAAVATILKRDIASTQLSLVHEADGFNAATSECAYIGADGASLARLMARWSPISDNTSEAIATARSTTAAAMKAFSSVPVEDIPGLGKAAFFVPPINQLNIFIDDARMIMITVEKRPAGASGKELSIALAKDAGA